MDIVELFEDNDKNLWVGTKSGLKYVAGEKRASNMLSTGKSFPQMEIISIWENSKGELFVSVRFGTHKIYKWQPEEAEFIPLEQFKRDGEISFVFDWKDDLWASSHGRGVYQFTPKDEIFFGAEDAVLHGMQAMFTNAIYRDKYDNIWVEGEELYYMPGHHKAFHSIKSDRFQVISVFADTNHIWYCSDQPYKWSMKEKQSEAYLEDVDFTELLNPDRERKHKRIYQYKQWNERLVFTSIRNVFVWDYMTDSYIEYPTNMQGAFREFIIDDEDYLWFPGDKAKPAKIDLNTGKIQKQPQLSELTSVCAVVQTDAGEQWWGTTKSGLFTYDPSNGEIQQFVPDASNPSTSISSYSINDLLVHSDSSIWIGSRLGLDQIHPGTYEVIHHPLTSQNEAVNVNSILEDDDGKLWLGTEFGLVFYNPENNSSRTYTNHDGLVNTNYTPRACYKDTDGWLYFGGDNGVDYFLPDEILKNQIPPEVYLSKLKVNGKPYNESIAGELLQEVNLSYQQNFLEIELIGLHFVAAEAQEYAYRISDQAGEWNSLGQNRVITLARLSPGQYMLEAKSANPDGIWSEPKVLLSIYIHPPFWGTS